MASNSAGRLQAVPVSSAAIAGNGTMPPSRYCVAAARKTSRSASAAWLAAGLGVAEQRMVILRQAAMAAAQAFAQAASGLGGGCSAISASQFW
jgi:hypothetical protein